MNDETAMMWGAVKKHSDHVWKYIILFDLLHDGRHKITIGVQEENEHENAGLQALLGNNGITKHSNPYGTVSQSLLRSFYIH